MKELEKVIEVKKDTIEIVKQVEHEYTLKGSVLNIHNHPLWVYDFKDDTLEESKKIMESSISLKGKVELKSKVNYDPNKLYFFALNRKNALKKLIKMNILHNEK